MPIYLDNAATTPLDKAVLEEMLPYMTGHFGNPSSIHSHGREVRSAIEKSRKNIASLFNVSPAEIFFTSGGTEADNLAIQSTIRTHNIKHAITSKIEHHAVLHTLEALEKSGNIQLSFVELDSKGHIVLSHLEELLKANPRSLVSIMHANNEIGNINPIEAIAVLCDEYKAVFHCDTVQTMGYLPHDLQKLQLDFLVGSAHKFHGPKGIGFIYVNGRTKINPLIYGGSQERNMRGGTENVYGIIGVAKALELAYSTMDETRLHITTLKNRLIELLKQRLPGVGFNGDSESASGSLYKVLNASMPKHEINEMILFNLDIKKISVSGGSACSSGTDIGSHVLNSLKADPEKGHIRFSFSKYNTMEEVEEVVKVLEGLYKD